MGLVSSKVSYLWPVQRETQCIQGLGSHALNNSTLGRGYCLRTAGSPRSRTAFTKLSQWSSNNIRIALILTNPIDLISRSGDILSLERYRGLYDGSRHGAET